MKKETLIRATTIRWFIAILAGMLVAKLFQLQILDRSYQDRARAMVFKKEVLYPSRGLIFDRDSTLFVHNDPVYDILAIYNQIDPDMDTSNFCHLLGIDEATFVQNLTKDWSSHLYSRSLPFTFLSAIDPQTIARFQEHLYKYPGFIVQLRNMRSYPVPHAAQLIGYISEVSRDQIEASNGEYTPGDYIGVSGLEKFYEKVLRGKKGAQYVVHDNLGRVVGNYDEGKRDLDLVSGGNIHTSIDLDLQKYAEQLLKNKKGSVVAIEPRTGEILAMANAPTYDPNLLSIQRDRSDAYLNLQDDPAKPLYNRAITARYPPGSIFKSVLALIALQEDVVDERRYIYCHGGYIYNNEYRKCHDHPSPVNIERALQYSCNTYFFQIFRELVDRYGFDQAAQGLDSLNISLSHFGIGQQLGIDLPNEQTGNLPSSEFYNKLYPKNFGGWKSPTIMSMGIGQGELLLTPLQMANLAAIIANNGYFRTPHIAREINGYLSTELTDFTKKRVPIDQRFFPLIQNGMQRAVEAGTGWAAYVPGVTVCGKTGTAQNPHGRDHSIFFAFAPRENPQIALAAIVENGGDGAWLAAPICGLIIDKYLNGEISPQKKYLENRLLKTNLLDLP